MAVCEKRKCQRHARLNTASKIMLMSARVPPRARPVGCPNVILYSTIAARCPPAGGGDSAASARCRGRRLAMFV